MTAPHGSLQSAKRVVLAGRQYQAALGYLLGDIQLTMAIQFSLKKHVYRGALKMNTRISNLGQYTGMTLEEALVEVWRQALIDKAKAVRLGDRTYPVRFTGKKSLRQVDFQFDAEDIRGLEQNPNTTSRWAAMARSGKKVMQFLKHSRYIASVADGKLTLYGPKPR